MPRQHEMSISPPSGLKSREFDIRVRPHLDAVARSKIGEVAALGFGKPDIIPLWFGEGDLPTPNFICDAAYKAMKAGRTFYARREGNPELRAAISRYLSQLHLPLKDDRIVVTSSAMNAIMLVMQALVGPGDNVVVVSPVWPNVVAAVSIVGGSVKQVALDPQPNGGFELDVKKLFGAVDSRTRAIYVNSPSNPTGWTMTSNQVRNLLDWTRNARVPLIADEVYSRIVYDAEAAPSFLDCIEPNDPVIVVNSFSKAWAMTGWRLGWLVLPPALRPTIEKLIEFNVSAAPTFLQDAAVDALDGGESFVKIMRDRCRIGRDIVVDALQSMPRVRIERPNGSFYAFFGVEGLTDSVAFAKKILLDAKVGLAPGAAFGEGGEGHLRLCFASSADRLNMAVQRLAKVMRSGRTQPASPSR